MNRVGALLNCGFLTVHSVTDLRERRIRLFPCIGYITGALLMHLVLSDGMIYSALAGIGSCSLLFLAARLSGQSIGYGDCVIIAGCASMTGMYSTFRVLFLALLLSSAWALFLMIKKKARRKDTFPFVPFLLLAQILLVKSVV